MNVDRNAPATAEGELQIAADPDTVWQVLADLERWPTWNPDVRSITLDGPLEPGSVFRWRAGTSLTSTLQVVDRPRELAWTGTTFGIRAVHVFRFEPRDGGTRASSEESWDGLPPPAVQAVQSSDAGARHPHHARAPEGRVRTVSCHVSAVRSPSPW